MGMLPVYDSAESRKHFATIPRASSQLLHRLTVAQYFMSLHFVVLCVPALT